MTSPIEPEANQTPCERAEPLLSAYLLEEISGDEREAVADHLAACEHCRDELDMLRGAVSILRSIPPLEAGLEPEGRERILAEARESAAAAARPGYRRVIYLAVAGLAAAAVLAVALFPGLFPIGGRNEAGIEVVMAPEPVRLADEPILEARRVEPEVERLAAVQDFPVDAPAEGDRLSLATREAAGELFYKEAKPPADGTERAEAETARRLVEQLKATELARADDSRELRAALNYKRGGVEGEARGASPKVLEEAELVRLGKEPTVESAPRGLVDNLSADAYGERRGAGAYGARPAGEAKDALPVSLAENGAAPAPDVALGLPLERSRTYRFAVPGEEPGLPAGPRPAPAGRPATAAAEPGSPTIQPPRAPALAEPAASVPGEAPVTFGAGGAGPPATAPADKPAEAKLAAGATVAGAPTGTAPAAEPWKVRRDDILSRLDRRPGETPAMMFFRYWGTNPFVEASSDPLSTFAVDVDTASYTIARAYLYERGILPPREAIRTEEFINFFKSRHAPPAADGPVFAIHAEMAPSPFAHEPEYQLLKVGLKGREVPREKRKACGLVFVIDTSGSMRQGNRLELVKEALRLLVPELDEGDTVGIVAFDREARVILDPAPASERERILDAISRLEPRQNTNVAAGLEMGYQMAVRHKLAGGSNRVILLSDGVANTGDVDPNAMTERVRAEREQGIYLTCVGVGMGNLNDTLMETLADRGNGQCIYVDRIEQAKKAFVDNLTGTLEAIAKDAKIQVEFDPAKVIRYRLLGYENRAVADQDFRDNKVDAGEVGAGHEVTALYELKLKPDAGDTLATIRVRYLTVDHGEAVEIARPVTPAERRKSFAEASPRFQVSAAAAELAEVLRGSYWARGRTLDRVAAILEPILGAEDPPRSNPDGPSGARLGDDNDVVELVALARKADALVREREAAADDVARVSDALKENAFLRAQVEDALRSRSIENQAQLDEIRRQNEALRRRLEDLLRQ